MNCRIFITSALIAASMGIFLSCSNKPETTTAEKPALDSCRQNTCCNAKKDSSDISCPYCGFKKREKLPDEICLLKYNCNNCLKDIFPKAGDCCVFCSYGNHKCPSKQ